MRKLRLDLEYEGTCYHGWQLQSNAITIQQVAEEALHRILGEACRLVGAGRTDAGVHAFGQVAHAFTTRSLDGESLRRALNSLLPEDIVVLAVREVPESFHARKSALKKRYEYWILNDSIPSALHHRFCWHLRMPLNTGRMAGAARYLLGEHDFSSFQASGCESADHPVREICALEIETFHERFIRVAVEAHSFLRHMVRNIVGTLVEVGLGRIPEESVQRILEARDRRKAGRTAPAKGLFLQWVCYEGEGCGGSSSERSLFARGRKDIRTPPS
jgi:tRNA pseudouridine38-40 synthase